METLFLVLLITGILYAVVTFFFGDWVGDVLDGFPLFQSTVLVSGLTAFGGSGLLLYRYSPLQGFILVGAALIIAAALATLVFFLYVKPMKNSENSIAFKLQSLEGAIGEVLTPIPASGYGEVLVKVGAGVTNQIAASYDGTSIPSDAKVVVVEVKEHTLFVSPIRL
ncbi:MULTISPECIES: NfeD family protein [unclassified Paenibacillus]|uniref:NfeD family protein n=1 Tax=unclassified Paenibacillus TaxID=185978 RepID=UPI002F3F6759